MTESEFETNLRADGYDEIEKQVLESRPGKGRHRHLFAIRGLVLSGEFIVAQTAEPVTYGSGDIFEVARGELHDEWIGAEGATVLVGKRHAV
jgi:quercetin dioxygenase-like cupin family protein